MRILFTPALAAALLSSDARSFAFTPNRHDVRTTRYNSSITLLSQSSNGSGGTNSSSSSNENESEPTKLPPSSQSSYLFTSSSSNYKMSITQSKNDMADTAQGGRNPGGVMADSVTFDASASMLSPSTSFPNTSASSSSLPPSISSAIKSAERTAEDMVQRSAEIQAKGNAELYAEGSTRNPTTSTTQGQGQVQVQEAEFQVQSSNTSKQGMILGSSTDAQIYPAASKALIGKQGSVQKSSESSNNNNSLVNYSELERQVEARVQKEVEATAEREVVAAAEKMVEKNAQAEVEFAAIAAMRAEKERRAEALVEARVEAAAEKAVIASTERMVEGLVESQVESKFPSIQPGQEGGIRLQEKSEGERGVIPQLSSDDASTETSESKRKRALKRVASTVTKIVGKINAKKGEVVEVESESMDQAVEDVVADIGSETMEQEVEDEVASVRSESIDQVVEVEAVGIESESKEQVTENEVASVRSESSQQVVENDREVEEEIAAALARKERLAELRVEAKVEAAAEKAVTIETERIVEGYVESQEGFNSPSTEPSQEGYTRLGRSRKNDDKNGPAPSTVPGIDFEESFDSQKDERLISKVGAENDTTIKDKGLKNIDFEEDDDDEITIPEKEVVEASRSKVEGALTTNAKAIAEIKKAIAEVEDDITSKKKKLANVQSDAYKGDNVKPKGGKEKVSLITNAKDVSESVDSVPAMEYQRATMSSEVDDDDDDDTWNFSKFMEEKFGFSDKKAMESAVTKTKDLDLALEPDESEEAKKTATATATKSENTNSGTLKEWKIEGVIDPTKTRTQRIMERTKTEMQTGGAGGVSTWDAFVKCEQNWRKLRDSVAFEYNEDDPNGVPPPYPFVTTDGATGNAEVWEKLRDQYKDATVIQRQCNTYLDYDVVVCGGTLGIFAALALQLKGRKVCVIEGGKLQGREQEWNISMDELMELVELGVLSRGDLDEAIKTKFPACRSGFKNREAPTKGSYFENGIGYEVDTPDVLNLGVAPKILIENVKQRFLKNGGVVKELTPIKGVIISEKLGAGIDLGDKMEPITSRLVLDCMGNASPISRQQRYGMKPDGVCCVVGSCAGGFDKKTNVKGDIIYTNSEMQDKGKEGMLQYFWEAFPVNIGRNGNEPGTSDVKTTYMFTYLDADKDRPDMLTLMEDYWNLLPIYQPSIKDPEKDLDVKRVLFAFFPTYRDSPLKPAYSRLLAIGDASGIQSPLSFGGFGALTRHLGRVSNAVDEALKYNLLSKSTLGEINPYTPNLSAAWMFQRAMSVRMGSNVDPKFVNRLLATNFQIMEEMGIDTIKPFLQDVIRIDGLAGSLARSFKADPFFMPAIVAHVGVPSLADWLRHVSMMGAYSIADAIVSPLMKPFVDRMEDKKEKFLWRRRMDAWKFGSGADYILPKDKK